MSDNDVERWQRAMRDTRHWRADARDMKSASDVLCSVWLEAVEIPPPAPRGSGLALPALMLAGYAVELYAKARILDRGGQMSDWAGSRAHDLPWLVERAGVVASPDEARVLRRVKNIVVWAGRYPVPMRAADFMPEGEPWARQVHSSDFDRIDSLCVRLAAEL